MAETVYHEPVGVELRLPDGRKLHPAGGAHVQVPAGTLAIGGQGAGEPRILPTAGVVIVAGTAGQTGPVGGKAPPTPTPVPTAQTTYPKVRSKVWNETPEGSRLDGGYATLRQAFQTGLPSQRQQLQTLARKPLRG